MQRLNNFIKKSIIGGLLVISPVVILYFAFRWAFLAVSDLINPIAEPLSRYSNAPEPIIDLFVVLLILVACFIVGNILTTRAGQWLHSRFDKSLSRLAPGYNLIRDVIQQFFGNDSNSPFKSGEVAVVRLFGADIPTAATCIVTSHHSNGWFTLFVPTGPNPTSGLIYHVPPEQVELLPHIKVDEALRTIISCGAGSGELLKRTT
ncbi:DUF502 domain-containing protein [Oceanicoccus sp. KOV_DT_Chl]|uniref:DUF502 domain-containing protein n=1 Tax=Oceanicoccus sp. KOV_DT_Chl TaxID=1904639 RepID=UPI000C7BE268|nr:DUF502 domain-containing protein [Oceanicoccus sp. KOV_DT_Chl]